MTIRRIKRFRRQLPMSDACIEAFKEWKKLEAQCDCEDSWTCKACERRRELNKTINDELRVAPWILWYRDGYLLALLARAAAEA
jgi:ubiquitin C-terminal hydrolase